MTDAAEIHSASDPHAEIARLRAEVEALRAQTIDLARRAEAAEAAADHDVLTPVLNRRGFVAALQRAMAYCTRYKVPAVLLYLDLDGFKGVNDSLGHAAGDAALVRVAELLLENVRATDAVGRLGGDEFGLLLLNAGIDEGREKAAGLKAALAQADFRYEGQPAPLGGSFGVRAFTGQADVETWLAEADAAMWVRKRGR
ncbi:GGDEF domain-containing protein [Brevundimonas subvibrioides]|uniref:diguanylate cyclase n=1 Tax=Brevundimonas subvibrioides (strain ATCC 15264 / DSM 4735 / LMG 14903 / NBRC 16000 / CB 81) TaxID=633149 RepID=D9QFS8_BRESC|nr:GGDEF domain-containing protein [Brevundimonas subvibrioides]ADL00642.1 diguanylate cyclase [Brevundimonas subvibrioides ATCC 15264]